MKTKMFIFLALVIGMIQMAVLNFVPHSWIPPFFSFSVLVDVIYLFSVFNYIDNNPKQ